MRVTIFTIVFSVIFFCSKAQFTSSGGKTTTTDVVGIGIANTVTPASRLDVSGAVSIGNQSVNGDNTKLFIRNTSGKKWALSSGLNYVNETDFGIYNWTDDTAVARFDITATGNVGIGTNSPAVPLDVYRNSISDPVARFGSTTSTNAHSIWVSNGASSFSKVFVCGSSGNFFNGTQQGDGGMLVTAGKSLFMGDNSGTSTMILKGGNVGIGTTTPNNKLQVADGADDASAYGSVQIIRPTNPGDNRFHLAFIRSTQMVSGIGYVSGTNTLGIWANVNTSTTPSMCFTQAGSVSIGTPNAPYKLTIDPQGAGGMFIGNTNTISGGFTSLLAGISTQSGGYAYLQGVSASGTSYGYMALNPNGGNVLIGKTSQSNSAYMLDINGATRANKVVVNTTGADYVFDSSYNLKPLSEVETYIGENKHLPDIASAEEMQKEGLNLGDNQTKLLQKIEELTLYLIEQKKQIDTLQKEVTDLKKVVKKK